jgi:hydroxymethylbilane synthase
MERSKIVLGTRGSELARAQARLVSNAIQTARPDVKIEAKMITTRGDTAKVVDLPAGRKGFFTAEIERALLTGDVDVAVHSAKDLPSETDPRAEIRSVLPRAPTGDVLVSKHAGGLISLPKGAVVATGSVRRKHQLCWKLPDLTLIDLRGNVPTRLRKLAENKWDAIVLARAGLERLGLSPIQGEINFQGWSFFVELLPPEIFLPAGGQGIIAVQIRRDDERSRAIVDPVNDRGTLLCLRAERKFLLLLQGDCNSPVGVLARIGNAKMRLRAQVFEAGSAAPREAEVEGDAEDGELLATQLLARIRGK